MARSAEDCANGISRLKATSLSPLTDEPIYKLRAILSPMIVTLDDSLGC